MFNKVNKLLEQYIGGQIFFTELDKAVKFDTEILRQLIGKCKEEAGKDVLTIASGEIGLAMHNYNITIDFLVPGGLRFEPDRINLAPFADLIRGRKVAFIDDSYFSGKTMEVVKREIVNLGGLWLGAWVAYDGARHKDENVRSLYRYYDHFDILGQPLKK